jgi:Ca2+:H+ antiporter
VAVDAEWMVASIDGISTTISKEWIGLILLPAVSSVAGTAVFKITARSPFMNQLLECVTAVNVSVKDHLTFSINLAVGSTIVSDNNHSWTLC